MFFSNCWYFPQCFKNATSLSVCLFCKIKIKTSNLWKSIPCMFGLHCFKTHSVLPSNPQAGMGLSTTSVSTFFLTGSSSNNPHPELQTNSNSVTYLPPSNRLMRSETLLDFSFVTLGTGVGVSSSILGFWFDKALCLEVWYVTADSFCRWTGFGGTAKNNKKQLLRNCFFERLEYMSFLIRTYYSNQEELLLALFNL